MSDSVELQPAEALRDLERFVVENDDLLELEERIGRFNIFDALRIARTEIRHSNFLAWLLDPNESHGLGSLFLRAVVMDLLSQMPQDRRPLSPVDLDGAELHGVEIRREWRHIDILITCERPRFVIAIENKVDSGEGKTQLGKYEETVRKEFAEVAQPIFVFLTREGDEASDEDWVPYSYADIHRVFSRCQRTNAGSIGDDVAAFLEHYLRLIGSRFMDDPKIDELCRKIYQNHRQALDLIVDRVGAPGLSLAVAIEGFLRQQGEPWMVVRRTRKKNRVYFVHRRLLQALPAIHDGGGIYRRMQDGNRCWIYFSFEPAEDHLLFSASTRATRDEGIEIRKRIVERLTRDPKDFGFRKGGKAGRFDAAWMTLQREVWHKWSEEDEPASELILAELKQRLAALDERLQRAAEAVEALQSGGA